MRKTKIISSCVMLLFLISLNISCAEITPPTPMQVLKHPLGTDSLRKGMNKEEVMNLWGQPNEINKVQQEQWSEPKEEWVYPGRYPVIPVDADYLSKNKYLYFEGDTLINWKTEGEDIK